METNQSGSEVELKIRKKLSDLGFKKIRKKYGHGYEKIISADIADMRIWVHPKSGQYQIHLLNGERGFGTITDLFNMKSIDTLLKKRG